MFDDLKQDSEDEEKVLVNKSLIESMKQRIKLNQKLIEKMVTDLVAKNIEIRELENIAERLQEIVDGYQLNSSNQKNIHRT